MNNCRRRFAVHLKSLALVLAVVGAAAPLHAEVPPTKNGVPAAKLSVPATKITVPAPSASIAPFTADTVTPAKRQGMVSGGGLNWQCQSARCLASGAPALFGVDSCRALALVAGQIRNFASAKHALSAAELSQCNAGIGAGAAGNIVKPVPAPMMGLPSVTNPSPSGGGKPAQTAPTGSKLPLAHTGGGFAPSTPQTILPPSVPSTAGTARRPVINAATLRYVGRAPVVINASVLRYVGRGSVVINTGTLRYAGRVKEPVINGGPVKRGTQQVVSQQGTSLTTGPAREPVEINAATLRYTGRGPVVINAGTLHYAGRGSVVIRANTLRYSGATR